MRTLRVKLAISFGFCLFSAFLLFFNLGEQPFWDDEATTALFAQSVWQTGDTSAQLDHNVIAYSSGKELKDLHNRYIPPLSFYIAAPFVGLVNNITFAGRLPFAVFGLLTIILLFGWMIRSRASMMTIIMGGIGIITNASLFLHFRQCRYYALAIFFTLAISYVYINFSSRRRDYIFANVLAVGLFASNYMAYAALLFVLAVDYFCFCPEKRKISSRAIAALLIPQLVVNVWILKSYHLLVSEYLNAATAFSLLSKIELFWWYLRDLNSCEFAIGIFVIASPFVGMITKDQRLIRMFWALIVYCLGITLLSPNPTEGLQVSFVRYLAPVIPLGIFISVFVIQHLIKYRTLAVIASVFLFGTNIAYGGPLVGTDKNTVFTRPIHEGAFRSTIVEFIKDTAKSKPSAYAMTADWINQNVVEGDSIWVMPGYATYPLMVYAPKAVYAWQIDKRKNPNVEGLEPIHYLGEQAPEYVIIFGPYVPQLTFAFDYLKEKTGDEYEQTNIIDVYWYDLSRPELFWHSFDAVINYNTNSEAVYVFRRKK